MAAIQFATYAPTPANIKRLLRLFNSIKEPASLTKFGLIKKGAKVTPANVDNTDAGAKINALIASLTASGVLEE